MLSRPVPVDFLNLSEFVLVGSNYLELADDIPPEVLPKVYGRLRMLDGAVQWMMGDFLRQVARIRGDQTAQEMIRQWSVSETRAYVARRVCEAIPREQRVPSLSFSHHECALDESDCVEDALEWLDLAKLQRLSVKKLRARIRADRQSQRRESQAAPLADGFRPFYSFVAFAQRHPVESLSQSDRAMLVPEARELRAWVDRLLSDEN